jgi:hypothetical protein
MMKLTFRQLQIYQVAHAVAIRVVATKETCKFNPKFLDNPETTLAGAGSTFAILILDLLQPFSSSDSQAVHQAQVHLHKLASSLAVMGSLVIELGCYPLANSLMRTKKSRKEPGPPKLPQIPATTFAFGSAMVSPHAF